MGENMEGLREWEEVHWEEEVEEVVRGMVGEVAVLPLPSSSLTSPSLQCDLS